MNKAAESVYKTLLADGDQKNRNRQHANTHGFI